MKIMLNGTVCEEHEAFVSVYDHGFMYGIGLFETFRTYNGAAFLLNEHLRRLSTSCAEVGIQLTSGRNETELWIKQLLEANGLDDAYFRLSVSAGVAPLGLPSDDYQKPNIMMYVKPLPPSNGAGYGEGKSLQLLSTRRNSAEGNVRFKSFHYMNTILGKRELQSLSHPGARGAEGLMLSEQGFLAEGLVSNLFFIRDGICHTPSIETGILPGITRGYVLKTAARYCDGVQEGLYTWQNLLQAEEVFLTNSIQEIVPVYRLLDCTGSAFQVRSGQTGPMTRSLIDQYRRDSWGCRKPSGFD